jgi:hypothetical protein
MKAELLLEERIVIGESAFVEIVVWRLPKPARGSAHAYKYRLALVEGGICTLRYDNEAGKGDHRHIGSREERFIFTSPEDLLDDFWADVDARRR